MIFRENNFWRQERWPATLATSIAIGLFWLSNGPNPVIIFLTIVWLVGYFVSGRISTGPAVTWVARVVLYSIVYFGNSGRDTSLVDTVFVAQWMTIFAQFAIAEFALRRWRPGPVPLWADILPSGVIMLAACSTLEPLYVTFLAPLYFLFIVLAFAQIGHRADAPLSWRWLNLATRILSLLLALGIGCFAHYCFRQYKSEILDWGSNVLGEHVAEAANQVSITGISKSPQLGPTFNANAPPTRMLLIHGTLSSPYMRGMSYLDYLRGSWGPALDARKFASVGHDVLSHPAPPKADSIDVERLVSDDEMVSFPLACSSIALPRGDDVTWAENDGGPLRVGGYGTLRYHCVLPEVDACQGIACRPPSPSQRRRLVDIPFGIDKRVVKLGSMLTRNVGAATAIRQVVRYLMTNNRYSYSTDPGEGDPVSNFILQHKAADCEYFASAATMLLRAGGIPTRFVIGYYAHESSPDGTIVRASDAHAWAESYVDGVGWVTVDATPPSGRPDVTQKLGLWWQMRDDIDDDARSVVDRWEAMSAMQQTQALVAVALAFALYYLLRSWHVRRTKEAVAYRYARSSPTLVELSGRFERLLTKRQAPCPESLPWGEHIQNITQDAVAPSKLDTNLAAKFVREYSELRFGNADNDDKAMDLSAQLTTLESEKQ